MLKHKILIIALLAASNLSVSGQTQPAVFDAIYNLIEQKNFFEASEKFAAQRDALTEIQRKTAEALLDNAFNRLENSNRLIHQLLQISSGIPDSIRSELYITLADNCAKMYAYTEAKDALETLLENYGNTLTQDARDDIQNSLRIWSALVNTPAQVTLVRETSALKMHIDKAGLHNLAVSDGSDSLHFIFDTGANLSTVSKSTAATLDMQLLPVDIQVGTITGQTVIAQIAVCPLLLLGNIEIRNAVFLVLNDSALSFPQIDYSIRGILGFPIIESLREIQITRDGYFIVPKDETDIQYNSNMAMDGLTPLIYINQMHFTFDTGADNTLLYQAYYHKFQQAIDAAYQPETFSLGGAGGSKQFEGFLIDVNFRILDREIALSKVELLKEKKTDTESVYGNIGQDVIRQFDKMTINFDRMFIKFD